MERRDKYSLSETQEKILIEAREKLVQLLDSNDALGFNTPPRTEVMTITKAVERLLGY